MDGKLYKKINGMTPEELINILDNKELYTDEVIELANYRLSYLTTPSEDKTEEKSETVPNNIVNDKTSNEYTPNTDPQQKNGLILAYAKMFKNYSNFMGRSSRGDFWYAGLMNGIIAILFYLMIIPPCISMLSAAFSGNGAEGTPIQIATLIIGGFLYLIWLLASLIPSLALSVRRLHDIGKSGWWYFISCVPIVGVIILLVYMATKGEEKSNKYGENPLLKQEHISTKGVKIGFIALVILVILSVVIASFSGTSITTLTHAEGNIEVQDFAGNVILDKYNIKSAEAKYDESQGWYIELEITSEGREKFAEATGRISKNSDGYNYIEFYIEGDLISSPVVIEQIDSNIILITGQFTKEHAEVVAKRIMYAYIDFGDEYNDGLDPEEERAYEENKKNLVYPDTAYGNKSNKGINIKKVRESLKVPDNSNITYDLGIVQEREDYEYVSVGFYENGEYVAGANINLDTGDHVSNITIYAGDPDAPYYTSQNIKYDSKKIDNMELSGLYQGQSAICSVSMYTGEPDPEINGMGVIEGNLGALSFRGILYELKPNLFLVQLDMDKTDETFAGDTIRVGFSRNNGVLLDMFLNESHIGELNMTEHYVS